MTTLKPEVRITRKCLAQVRARVAVADLAFTTSKFTAVSKVSSIVILFPLMTNCSTLQYAIKGYKSYQ